MTTLEVDVAVLGAGFGGSLTALLLERIGLDVAAVDRATHPRFAIGESSTPTANLVLRDLVDRHGLDRLRPLCSYGPWQDAYPEVIAGRKRGFSYFRHRPGEAFHPSPDHADELLVAASSDPYRSDTQWLRADVDAFLSKEARQAGVPVLEGTEVRDVAHRDGWRIRARRPRGPVELRADFLVDATGGGRVLPLGDAEVAVDALDTRTRALYGHFRGLSRWRDIVAERGACTQDHPFPCDEAALHHVLDEGWLWELRFNDGRVSAGLVLDLEQAPPVFGSSPEEEWTDRLARYPSLSERFADAEIVDPPGRIVRTGRLQRLAERAAGPGWAMLPSSAGFADPLHSTGIAHTMSGIERLVRILEEHGPAPPSEPLRRYDADVRTELEFVDDLAAVCYDALPSFRGWVAATKLYFTAATRYERLRIEDRDVGDDPSAIPGFLCADEDGLRELARNARSRLADWPRDSTPDRQSVISLERFLRDRLAPYDEVGLFEPPMPRMHPHTAAPIAEPGPGPGSTP